VVKPGSSMDRVTRRVGCGFLTQPPLLRGVCRIKAAPFTYRVHLKAIHAIIIRLFLPASAPVFCVYHSSAGRCPSEPVWCSIHICNTGFLPSYQRSDLFETLVDNTSSRSYPNRSGRRNSRPFRERSVSALPKYSRCCSPQTTISQCR
jgi:hypothetical protein